MKSSAPPSSASTLRRLVAVGREHDDRDLGELADPAADLQAVEVGQAQVQDDQVRIGQCDLGDGLGPECAVDDLVAAGGQADAQRLDQRRIVVDHQHLASWRRVRPATAPASRRDGEDDAGPAATSRIDPDEPAVGLDEGLGDGQAESGPAAPPFWLNISKTRSRSSRAMPGPSSVTAISTWRGPRRGDGRAADADDASSRRDARRRSRAGWPAPGRSGRDRCAAAAGRGDVIDARPGAGATISPSDAERLVDQFVEGDEWCGRSSRAPDSIRVMSSRLVTSRARRSDCSSMSSSSSARSSAPSVASTWRRLDTAVLMEASGVRRSCETAPMRARRQRSISSSRRVRSACSRSCARSTASAAWLANVPSRPGPAPRNCTSWSTSMPTGRLLATSATATRRGRRPVQQARAIGSALRPTSGTPRPPR